MGSLSELPPAELMVKVSETAGFGVRGLSPFAVLGLYRRHAGALSSLFETFVARVKREGQTFDVDTAAMNVGVEMLAGMPQLMAEIIALGGGGKPGTPEFEAEVETALALSIGVQTDALQKIASLTFTSDMPPGKFLAVVLQAAQATTAAVTRKT